MANFIETEQILQYDGHYCSYVQVRFFSCVAFKLARMSKNKANKQVPWLVRHERQFLLLYSFGSLPHMIKKENKMKTKMFSHRGLCKNKFWIFISATLYTRFCVWCLSQWHFEIVFIEKW